jgi:RNA polymerase sigma factor (sigma-70 family)
MNQGKGMGMKSILEGPSITPRPLQAVSDNARLVRECLDGDPNAWAELVDKYKNLIFSIPIKYGLTRDEAADIFQDVCLKLLSDLKNVRDPQALPKWIIQVTSHNCFHHKIKRNRFVSNDSEDQKTPDPQVEADTLERIAQSEEEQMIREVLTELSPRCNQLIQMLFFEEPSRSYRDIASNLGIAVGSIGIMRQRCIERLRKRFEDVGMA